MHLKKRLKFSQNYQTKSRALYTLECRNSIFLTIFCHMTQNIEKIFPYFSTKFCPFIHKFVALPIICYKFLLSQKISFYKKLNPDIPKKKNAQKKVSCQFLSRILFKKFFEETLLENNLTHSLKKTFSKNVFNSKRITFSKESNSLFSNHPCFSLFRFFDNVFVNFDQS